MELEPIRQAAELIKQSRTPLIIIPEQPTTDAIAAALGLFLIFELSGQKPRIVSPKFTLPTGHSFLPKSDAIEQGLTNLRDFIISVDLEKTKLESLRYAIDNNKLHIYLTPKQGFYSEHDVRTSAGKYAHDLIIVIDTRSLQALGQIVEDNPEFFQHTPIINIDYHPANDRFGNVPLIDVVANAASEIVFELIQTFAPQHLNDQVATTILAGIMSKTKAFQSQRVTPRSLAVASHLVNAGARREEIVRNLYQTKSLATLKLWGIALTRLQSANEQKIVWSYLEPADLESTQADREEAIGVLDELMVSSPNADYYLLCIGGPTSTEVIISFAPNRFPKNLPTTIQPISPEQARGVVDQPVKEASQTILSLLQDSQGL